MKKNLFIISESRIKKNPQNQSSFDWFDTNRLNPGLFNPKLQLQTFQPSLVEKVMVQKSGVEKSGVEMSFNCKYCLTKQVFKSGILFSFF